jgi:FtsH-binding integral membrane protein
MFLVYCALSGVTFSVIFLVYTRESIASTFFITGGVFGAMSAYGTLTKKDLSSWGSFLMMGLIGVIIAGVVNIFLRSSAMSFVISCASVVVFTGLTAWDTQKIRQVANQGDDRLALQGALMLYLDFVNLFLALLNLLGRRR